MRKNVYTISLIIFTAFIGCSKSDNQEKIIEIEKEFSFQPWQTLTESGGEFSLVAQTIKKQECGGAKVNISTDFNSKSITIKVNGLSYPPNCGSQAEIATDTVKFNSLSKGTYNFKITLKDAVVNEGSLIVEDNKYSLNMNRLYGIELPQTEIMRIPKGLIWGYVTYEQSQEAQYVKFESKLKKFATLQSDIPKGDYGYFTINDQAKFNVKVTIDQPKATTKHLLYYLNSNNTELKNLVDEFRDSAFEIKFFTSDGKVF
jgi:hypothetical protein